MLYSALVLAAVALPLAPASDAALAAPASAFPANCSAGLTKQGQYNVSVVERSAAAGGGSLISHANGTSYYNFSFTTAWVPAVGGGDGLIVRVVECNANHHSCAGVAHPEWGNAGALAVVAADLALGTAERVQQANVTWAGAPPPPASLKPQWGAADPRAVFRPATGQYYVTWDNCSAANCEPHRTTQLSTTRDPFDASGWTLHGPLLGAGSPYTAGAALLFRDGGLPGPHLAFVSDSNTAHNINVATSSDGLAWAPANKTLLAGRPGCWDAPGVAVGPQPERLASGDYLLVYNIDTGWPLRPNPYGRCSVGWAILSGEDPTVVVARSEDALLTPTFPWETCAAEGKGYACQEPQVVFSTGLKPLGGDEFLVIYGAADTDVGVAHIKVTTSAA